MGVEFKVPELGEGVESAEVSRIYVSEGDTIESDQNVMELETEKAVADLPCPHAGKIAKIHVSQGDTLKIGQTVLTIEAQQPDEEKAEEKEPGGKEEKQAEEPPREQPSEAEMEKPDEEEERKEEQEKAPAAEEAKGEPEQQEEAERGKAEEEAERPPSAEKEPAAEGAEELPPPAGPATRRLARKLGVDLHDVEGSGRAGRILQEDVVEARDRASAPGGAAQPPLPDFEKFGSIERKRLNKVARTAMKHLRTSWNVIPQVTQHDVADVTDLESARQRYLDGPGQSGPKITPTAIAVKAVTTVLEQFPQFNASLDAEREELVLKRYYHIGVAVDTEEGLLVPVVRDADRKSIVELAEELKDLAEKARNRKLGMEDMEGATFTVSNQGGIGGTAFTPIVSFPQVAILGISQARPEVQMRDGQPRERLMLPLSLSYDHRVINGADAARFLVRLAAELSDCFQLLVRT